MRYVLGPAFQVGVPAPAPTPSGKLDVEVTVKAVDAANVTVTVPAYELGTHNQLLEVRAYLVPATATPPADAPSYIASAYPFIAGDVSANQAGADVELPLPTVDGPQLGQIVLGFPD